MLEAMRRADGEATHHDAVAGTSEPFGPAQRVVRDPHFSLALTTTAL